MKPTLFAIILACATASMGQGYISSQPQKFSVPENPLHASNHTLAEEQNLRGDISPYTYAKGELPLSDFARSSASTPLGDVARNLKKQHNQVRKATVRWAQ